MFAGIYRYRSMGCRRWVMRGYMCSLFDSAATPYSCCRGCISEAAGTRLADHVSFISASLVYWTWPLTRSQSVSTTTMLMRCSTRRCLPPWTCRSSTTVPQTSPAGSRTASISSVTTVHLLTFAVDVMFCLHELFICWLVLFVSLLAGNSCSCGWIVMTFWKRSTVRCARNIRVYLSVVWIRVQNFFSHCFWYDVVHSPCSSAITG